ncbi:MANSC domain-containing protein 4-like [Thalassophryne amazonica]|uniref:MANSC domain-containing protein 4-like n=1 Tax=Thalassophryne amazonica TaxID=390379 RepID=UPI0014723B97|nr:MANSC domain-containing protein 4-like [Thalassophryne amazonica]
MNVTRGLLTVLSLLCRAESGCSPTSYYGNCWIRRIPGIFIDIEESQRRGAQLLKLYQEESALKCSRACCLTRNFSCHLAVFHYDMTQESVNCFHLRCPTVESCFVRLGGNVVLYNITKGVDPDLLVFEKHFTSNVRVLPHHFSRVNGSETLTSDKRQFNHPPPPAAPPLTSATTLKSSTAAPLVFSNPATSRQTTHPPTTVSTNTTSRTSSITMPYALTTALETISTSTMPPTSTAEAFTSALETTANAQPSSSTPTQRHTSAISSLASSPPTSVRHMANTENSKPLANITQSAGSEVQGPSGEDTLGIMGPGWHVAAHTLLVAVATCITVLLICCCSVLLVVSWRGQRKRMGRYRTSWRAKSGSTRLIKYVLVRESS